MTYTEARDLLAARIKAVLDTDLPTLTAYWENTTVVDLTTAPDQFVVISIEFDFSSQATVNDNPIDRVAGVVGLRIMTRQGKGTRSAMQLCDIFNAGLRHRDLGGVTTKSPVFGPNEEIKGWLADEFAIPFVFYS